MMSYQYLLINFSALVLVGMWNGGIGPLVHTAEMTTQETVQEAEQLVKVKNRDVVILNFKKTKDEIGAINTKLSSLMDKLESLESAEKKTDVKVESLEENYDTLIKCEEARYPGGFLNQKLPSLTNFSCKCQGEVVLNVAGKATKFYCDMKKAGLVIQRRFDGSLYFNRNWNEYVSGFGSMKGEFWLGLDLIHEITSSGRYKLRIDMEDFSENKAWAEYDDFKINSASDNYRLVRLGSFSGNVANRFYNSLNMQFSTKDRDNDIHSGLHCGSYYRSGWWHRSCYECNLNYPRTETNTNGYIYQWYGWSTSISKSQMKLIPMN